MKKLTLLTAVISSLMFENAALAAATIEFSGLIELEASSNKTYSGTTSSDINLATIELALNAQVNKQLSAEVVLLHEEDDGPENLEVDIATLTLALNKTNWIFTAGQTYVPFGVFSTNMVSDPLTHELAETRETAVQLSYGSDNFSSAFYVFNGSNKQNNGTADKLDNFGINLNYEFKGDLVLTTNISYTNDIGDSNTLQDVIKSNLGSNDVYKHVAGIGFSAMLDVNNIHIIAETISATDNFTSSELSYNGQGAKPSAMNFEVGYNFTLFGNEATVDLAYQTTEQALGLGLPKSSVSTAITFLVMNDVTLAFEIAKQKDYSINNGGTGNTADTFTAKLATAF